MTNPKVVRAVGRRAVPRARGRPGRAGRAALRSGLRLLGTAAGAARPYTSADLTGRVAVVVGNEAHGLPDDAPVDEWISIPHAGRAESLNAAMAAAVICFEAARQRPLTRPATPSIGDARTIESPVAIRGLPPRFAATVLDSRPRRICGESPDEERLPSRRCPGSRRSDFAAPERSSGVRRAVSA